MSRTLILAILLAAPVAHADDDTSPYAPEIGAAEAAEPAKPTATTATTTEPDHSDTTGTDEQAVSAEIGIAGGGRVTPGGLRIAGRYLYQLSQTDWFDGAASFTYGGGDAQCFRDRMDVYLCDHGFTDGGSLEISASVRRLFEPRGQFQPFARVGIGVALVRFSSDDVSGIAFPLHGGGGVRARVAPGISVVATADITLGIGRFGNALGTEPQLGMTITAGAEFRLQ